MVINKKWREKIGRYQQHFWSRVKKSSECWIFQGCKNEKGYGLVCLNLEGQRYIAKAHRLAFYYRTGRFPHKTCVCHTCDNPACVRPSHLFSTSQAQNMRDCFLKNRHAKGTNHGRSKLTEQEVLQIRRILMSDLHVSYKKLADKFNIGPTVIRYIASYKIWKEPHLNIGPIPNRKHRR